MIASLDKTLMQNEPGTSCIDKMLSKPIKPHELAEVITSLFENAAPASRIVPVLPVIKQIGDNALILVAEDDPMNMLLISEVLQKMGFRVIKAVNGQEALEILPAHNPVMIFMDVNMPVMDGYTATGHIRRLHEPYCNIPIVALTADAMKEDREHCLEAGMNDFISKPFKLADIESAVKMFMAEVG